MGDFHVLSNAWNEPVTCNMHWLVPLHAQWCLRSVLGFRLVAEQLGLILFSKWRLVFPSSSALTLPHQFRLKLALESEGSQARSCATLPRCFDVSLFVCIFAERS